MSKFDPVLAKHYRRGMTVKDLLHVLSCEGGHNGRQEIAFRRLRTDERRKRIESYLKRV